MARSRQPSPSRLILDSGAVIALSRGEARVRAFVQRAVEVGAWVEVPAVVVAETTRGTARDAAVNRVLAAVGEVPSMDLGVARRAGALLGETGRDDTIGALVVAQAVEAGGGLILTSDLSDVGALAGRHPEVWVERV